MFDDLLSIDSRASAFFEAVENGDVDEMARLVEETPSLLFEKDIRGYPALHVAAVWGNVEGVRFLLDQGVSPGLLGRRRQTALHRAAEGYEAALPAMLVLIDAGAKIDARDSYWCTPLMTAANYSNPWAVTLLLGKGAKTHFKDRQGHTAMDLIRMTHTSALQNRRKYKQQIRECELIIELLRVAD